MIQRTLRVGDVLPVFDLGLYPNHALICIDIFGCALPVRHVNGTCTCPDGAGRTIIIPGPPE